ncbi:MAG: chromate transporter [Salinarimonadaceae bacterium]|nr:MAG: chromate transporter [Salinarimonadaceae bacterium]
MASEHAPAVADLPGRGVTYGQLFLCWLWIGATGFGGVLPIVVYELVTKRRWVTQDEFTEMLALCQVLPGPNIINFAVVFGMRASGWRGTVACLGGLLIVPMIAVMTLATVHAAFTDIAAVSSAIAAVAAAAAGLILAVTLKLLWPLRRRPLAMVTVVAGVTAIVIFRAPLIWTLAALVPLTIALTLWEMRRNG